MSNTITFVVNTHTLSRIFGLGAFAFFFSMVLTPIYTTAAYKYQ